MTKLMSMSLLGLLGLLVVAGANVATAAQKQSTNPHECYTDDGYGRLRPCSAGYQKKSATKTPDDCFTDDGYGRRRPCSADLKR